MKNKTLVWQKIATIAMLAAAFIAIISFASCDNPQSRTETIADEVVHYSNNFEVINDSIAVLKRAGTTNRNFIYKKQRINNRWKRVM